jgi:outer membrane lipoprotein-sorting protein
MDGVMSAAMKRLFFLGLCAVLLAARPAFALTDAEAAAVKKAEAALNAVTTMKSRFVQVDADGTTHEGDLYLSRPGKMRLVYDPPTQMLMVADGVFLIYVDKEMDDVSHIDLNDTPAGLLLKKNLSFSEPGVKLLGVHLGAGTVEITAAQAKDPAAGRLTFVFSENPFELRQWRVIDAQNKEVQVTLMSPAYGVPIDGKLFKYDPRAGKPERD